MAVVAVLAIAPVAFKGIVLLSRPDTLTDKAAPLVVVNSAPIGLIGTVVALGAGTVTIEGQPPGNTVPVRLEAAVDEKTGITRVGPAPAYATSTAAFADLKEGMLLNIEASAAENGIRHAERIIIPPPAGN